MNTITVVTQLINQARVGHGEVDAIAVPEALWEPAMEEVADAGGSLGVDHCVVDGVVVRLLEGRSDVAVAHLSSGESRELALGG